MTLPVLARVEKTTAHQLLSAVRYTTSPLGPTYIPSLDNFLSATDSANEDVPSYAEDPSAIRSSINRGDMIEIQGPSGSGKTQLAVFLLMTTLLPSCIKFRISSMIRVQEVEIGGKSQTATLLYPASHVSPVRRLAQLMKTHVRACLLSLDLAPDQLDSVVCSIINRSLSRLTVRALPAAQTSFTTSTYSPYATLIATLRAIHRQPHPTQEMGLLVIDGIGDAFWPSKAYVRPKNLTPLRGQADQGMGDLVRVLDRVRRDVGCAVVVTNQAIWRPVERSGVVGQEAVVASGLFWAQHLPAPWPTTTLAPTDVWPLTAHITLLPPSLTQIRPDVTLVDVLRPGGEGDKRESARAAARGKGVVRLGRSKSTMGNFGFAVSDEEVLTW
ncbi:hypothetical protein NliqN6_2514 [Naganishia liquefaciens]|uniref:DNA recombination and repair protein Rad51-like C-terminal domain-containing protein n=1 Tax=Naganishia liquefaciens TaxID=104408 RepID=A0A8H3YFD4_9TREE|nr:hypothetical protein NliqN6_2514 [Naganishia liquefaciens]